MERETAVMRCADTVVTLARTMREEIITRGVAPERIVLAPNAVAPSYLTPVLTARDSVARTGSGDNEFVVGSVSNLTPMKGSPL